MTDKISDKRPPKSDRPPLRMRNPHYLAGYFSNVLEVETKPAIDQRRAAMSEEEREEFQYKAIQENFHASADQREGAFFILSADKARALSESSNALLEVEGIEELPTDRVLSPEDQMLSILSEVQAMKKSGEFHDIHRAYHELEGTGIRLQEIIGRERTSRPDKAPRPVVEHASSEPLTIASHDMEI